MAIETSPVDQLWRALRRRPRTAMAAGALVTVLALIAGFSVVPVYEAHAKLVVEREQKTVDLAQSLIQNFGEDAYSILNTHAELLHSQQVLEDSIAATELGGQAPYDMTSDPVQLLGSRFRVLASRESWILDLSLRDESPERAKRILGVLIESYLAAESRRRDAMSAGTLGFLREQVDQARADYERAKNKEQELLREKGVVGLDPDSNHLTAELGALNVKRVELSALMVASGSLMVQLTQADVVQDPKGRIDALVSIPEVRREMVVAQALQSVAELSETRRALAETYKDLHPRMVEATAHLGMAELRLKNSVESTRLGLLQSDDALKRQVNDVDSRIGVLERRIREYREAIVALRARADETETAGHLFQNLLQRLHEQEVNGQLNAPRISIAQAPSATDRPVNIRRSLFLVGALISGMCAALAAALVHEALDRHVREPATLPETAHLPLLGRLPSVADLPPVGPDPSPVRSDDARVRALEDSIKLLRTAIQLVVDPAKGLRVIAVTSPGSGDGRTTVAARLAAGMANSGRRTLLVDGDLVKPSIHEQLGIERDAPGLTDLLGGDGSVAPLATLHPQLHILLAGTDAENSAELLHGTRLLEVASAWLQAYEVIIVDTPPLDTAEALELADAADHVVLVVRDRYTSREALKHALSRLARFPDKLLGVVANDDRDVEVTPRASPGTGGVPLQGGLSKAMRRALRM